MEMQCAVERCSMSSSAQDRQHIEDLRRREHADERCASSPFLGRENLGGYEMVDPLSRFTAPLHNNNKQASYVVATTLPLSSLSNSITPFILLLSLFVIREAFLIKTRKRKTSSFFVVDEKTIQPMFYLNGESSEENVTTCRLRATLFCCSSSVFPLFFVVRQHHLGPQKKKTGKKNRVYIRR